MKEKNKVSIIIPTYNREKVIKRSIESVLNQTYKNIEVIVVDDGSKDDTAKVINKINDDRIKYFKLEKNSGVANARNFGIKEATGEYIAFQDSDDVYSNNKIECQLKNILKNGSDMDFCKFCIHDNDIDVIVPNKDDDKIISRKGILDRLCMNNVITTQAVLIKSKILKKYNFDTNIPNTEDYDLVLRIAINFKISYTKKVLVDLYRQDDSISYSMDKLRKSSLSMLKKDYKLSGEQLENLHNHLFEQAARQEIEKYDLYCRNLKKSVDDKEKDNELLNIRVKNLISKNEDMEKEIKKYDKELKKAIEDYNRMSREYEKLNEKYNGIINSKRWKYMSKMLKIIRK